MARQDGRWELGGPDRVGKEDGRGGETRGHDRSVGFGMVSEGEGFG